MKKKLKEKINIASPSEFRSSKKYYVYGDRIEDADKARARVNKYLKSKRGKEVKQAYIHRNKERIRDYMRDYFRARRQQAQELGLCASCLKSKEANGTIFCNKCRQRNIDNAKKQKKYSKTIMSSYDINNDSVNKMPPVPRPPKGISTKYKGGQSKEKEGRASKIWDYMKKMYYPKG